MGLTLCTWPTLVELPVEVPSTSPLTSHSSLIPVQQANDDADTMRRSIAPTHNKSEVLCHSYVPVISGQAL